MKKNFLLFAFLLIGLYSFGQRDEKAKQILEQVTQKTQTSSSINAQFLFTMENKAEGINEANSGTLVMKGKKYKVTLPGMGLEITSDGTTIWSYMKSVNEVTISNIEDNTDDLMDPAKLFTIYENGFNYKFVSESVVDGVPSYVIDLFPTDKTKEFQRVNIAIDKQKMFIRSADMYGKDGNHYKIKVNSLKTDGVYKDSDFVFNKAAHPGVEVVDMR